MTESVRCDLNKTYEVKDNILTLTIFDEVYRNSNRIDNLLFHNDVIEAFVLARPDKID